MQKPYDCAVIFAGGKSSRMGTDKSLLPFGGHKSMSEYLHQKLIKQFKTVYVSAKSDKFDFSAKIIADKYEESSPMVALVSIFETIVCDEIFIVSVDMPLVSIEIIDELYNELEKSKESDAIIAVSPNGIEPMCGIYRRSICAKAKEYLDNNIHQLMKLLANSKVDYKIFDSSEEFFNLNSPAEYEMALVNFASLLK